jgi:transcriptional regulator with XRE-family HTH domain
MTSRLAAAVEEARRARGVTPAELARAAGLPEGTVGSILSGRSHRPQQDTRDRLDAFFDAPSGTTLAIAEGRAEGYPDVELRRLLDRLEPIGDAGYAALAAFIDAVSSPGGEGSGGGGAQSRR